MRGKAEPKRLWQLSGGITPAYAGKSNLLPHTRCRSWDHPRICGEKQRTLAIQEEPQGSPPRMRGKDTTRPGGCQPLGITPAYAGKSNLLPHTRCRSWDHPRICGEKPGTSERKPMSSGSPPRMRGKGDAGAGWCYLGRITPAYAGKSLAHVHAAFAGQDHPRICGEKAQINHRKEVLLGSPPHMRGKVHTQSPRSPPSGITPAYAGKSGLGLFDVLPDRDHPRICGEKPNRLLWEHWKEGSPPHMRGKAMPASCSMVSPGITPAYAGKRTFVDISDVPTRDHPRICGEKQPTMSASSTSRGSPPHMRGKAIVPCVQRARCGITPAYAGKRLLQASVA